MCSGVPFVGVGMMPEQDLNIRLAVNKGRRAACGTHFIADIAPFFCTLLLPHTCGKPLAWGILGALAFGAARFLALAEAHMLMHSLEKRLLDHTALECRNQRLSSPSMPRCFASNLLRYGHLGYEVWSSIADCWLDARSCSLTGDAHRSFPKSERNARSIQGNTPLWSWSSRNLLENEQQSWHLTRR